MEYASGGELKEYLQKRGKLSEREAFDIFRQLMQSVDYCHQKRIVHRDLKLSNIVFAKPNSREIRVVDFGISGLCSQHDRTISGSLKYMAPEVLSGKHTTVEPALDIYSMGVILFSLVTGKLPFDNSDHEAAKQAIIKGDYTFPTNIKLSKECREIISGMLKNDPKERL